MADDKDNEMNENEARINFDAGPALWLRWLLAITGVGLMVAMAAVFLPVSMMAKIHNWLGLGGFPADPITVYLARSTSLLYAIHGFLMLYVSFNLRRMWPLVTVFGWLHVVIGLTMFGIDITSPMPTYWIVGEGPPIAAAGGLILWLANRSMRTSE